MLRQADLQQCVTTHTADARRHFVSGLIAPVRGSLFTFCGKRVLGVVTDPVATEEACATCRSSARYWGFR